MGVNVLVVAIAPSVRVPANTRFARLLRGRLLRIYGSNVIVLDELQRLQAVLGDRFTSKIDTTGNCWFWTGSLDTQGYGGFSVNGSRKLAHRLSYAAINGDIPTGARVDHVDCQARSCVRPSHLRLVSHAENAMNRRGPDSDSQSGVRGVRWHVTGYWQARARAAGKEYSGGYFTSLADAELAAIRLRKRIHSVVSSADIRRERELTGRGTDD